MDATKKVGLNIRQYREKEGLKLEALATMIRVSKGTMSQIENGQTEITVSRIEKIAEALKIDYNLLAATSVQSINIHNSPQSGGIYTNNHINDKELVQRILDLSEMVVQLKNRQ